MILAACARPVSFQYDSSVPQEQQDLLNHDLDVLNSVDLPPGTPQDLQTAGIDSFQKSSVNKWLSDRTKIIVGESFNSNTPAAPYAPASGPPVLFSHYGIDASNGVKTVMTNIGASFYLDGKEKSAFYEMDVVGESLIVKTPRVGVEQIGEALFSTNRLNGSPSNSMAASMLRLATLFHEARHSDGNGAHAAFPHTQCPSGKYAGYYACETYANGAYSVQAVFATKFYQTCSDCSPAELQALLLVLADYKSRILPGATYKDPTPEGWN